MAIKKYVASADNTIVNTYKENLTKRATGSNAGAADIIETYSIYGRQSSGSAELSRILIKFPISQITTDRNNNKIPGSGSVKFYLKLHSAASSKTVPSGTFTMVAEPISKNWQEGYGLDLESYADQTNGNIGSNWMSASDSVAWTKAGGDYITAANAAYPFRWFSQTFYSGLEDFEIDITQMVELWSAGTLDNYGLGVHFSGAYEAYYSSSNNAEDYSGGVLKNITGSTISYYTKRFFARGTQYFFKRPVIEARWDSTRRDDRGEVMYSSSLAGVNDNLNTLYLYNYVRGALTNIPAINKGAIYVSFYSGSDDNTSPSGQAASSSAATRAAIRLPTTLPYSHVSTMNPFVVTGGWVATGIYTASFAITGNRAPLTKVFDVWHNGAGKNQPWTGVEYATASFSPTNLSASQTVAKPVYFINITNLRESYVSNETARFNLFVRNKDWSPNIYTVANSTIETTTIHSASYRVFRIIDALEVVPHGTGSDAHTILSHDVSGNYFDFDMSLLDPGYEYAFKFSFYDSAMYSWSEQPELFKFRVIDNEY